MLKTFLSKKGNKILFFVAVAVFSFAITSFGISKTGQTWDEIAYFNAGRDYLKSASNLDFSSEAWSSNKEHPGFAKYIYGLSSISAYRAHEENFNPGRLASAVLLSLTIAAAALFGALNFSPITGIISALILSLSPPFIAYGRVLGMDSITALMFTLVAISFFYFAKSKGTWRDYILPSLVFGLAINTRYNLILSIALLPIAVALFASWKKNIWRWVSLILIPVFAVIVFYLTWPFLYQAPIEALKISLGHWGQVREWYLGVANVIPPRSYYLMYFICTTPLVVLILFLLGVFRRPFNREKIYLFCWLIIPFAQSFFGLKQNGIRYLLPVWIPLAILAAWGFVYILNLFKQLWIKIILVILLGFYFVFIVINYYPYYLDYYNEAVGGARGVYEKKLLQLGWWGEGGEEATKYLNENANQNASVFLAFKPEHALSEIRPDLVTVAKEQNPDYILINTEYWWVSGFQIPANYDIIHEVKAGGAPIVTIMEKK